ncbi:MAG: fluoride efflux transporter CrcB [Chitinophagales bacterium]|nr:fluoride efflux transporter CrcB [Chitinophagales bacterium]
MKHLILVAAGGAIGSVARYGMAILFQSQHMRFPWGTFTVNLLGAFVIGLLWAKFGGEPSAPTRSLLFIGLLGGFTTFSSFALESLDLINKGLWATAVVYILATNLLGLALVFTGYYLAKL